MILLDTDHLSVLSNAHASAFGALRLRMEAVGIEAFGVPVVAAEEQCRGWLAQINRQRDAGKPVWAYDNLADLFDFLGEWEIVRFDARAAEQFNSLRKQLRRSG